MSMIKDMTKRDFLKLGVAAVAVPRLWGQRPPRPPRVYPKLGILCNYTEKNMDTAARVGAQCLELQAGPRSNVDVEKISAADASAMQKKIAGLGLEVAAYACHFNHLGPAADARARNNAYFAKLIQFCADTGVKCIGTHTGGLPNAKIDAQLEEMKRAFTPYLELCEKHKVYLGLEGYPSEANFATTPENIERIFETLPSQYLGLEYDPSHMVRQMIDPISPARQFKQRIYHVHAKDTEIVQPVLQRRGVTGEGWWRYRLPGYGEVKWNELITVLLEANFSGGIDVEHEDVMFDYPNRAPDITEGQAKGYHVAIRYLSQYLPGRS